MLLSEDTPDGMEEGKLEFNVDKDELGNPLGVKFNTDQNKRSTTGENMKNSVYFLIAWHIYTRIQRNGREPNNR